ncbi:MAG: hypothetical protein J7L77_02290 [Clostridiales bacterium]|nr:hypothetical protein [Clostridiales bacterium]
MKYKTIIIIALIILLMSFSITASAATVNDILQALRDANVPEVYVLQAESYMAGKTVTPAIADAIIVHINNADTIAAGETKLSVLNSSQKNDIMIEIAAATALLDLTVSYVDETLTVKDDSENIVGILSLEDAIKQTGYDYNLILYGVALFLLTGVAVIATRKKLSKGTAQ